MNFYRIKHKPSGLYFCPSRRLMGKFTYPTDEKDLFGQIIDKFKPNQSYIKSNLSSKGKIYTSRPSLRYLGKIVNTHVNPKGIEVVKESWSNSYRFKVIPEDWEIEECTGKV